MKSMRQINANENVEERVETAQKHQPTEYEQLSIP